MFGDIFKNVSFALNYVGHVMFAATWATCSLSFVDDHFKSWQTGMRREKTSRNDVVKHAPFLLTTSMATQVVKYLDAIEDEEAAMLTIQCWQEFLRVHRPWFWRMVWSRQFGLTPKDMHATECRRGRIDPRVVFCEDHVHVMRRRQFAYHVGLGSSAAQDKRPAFLQHQLLRFYKEGEGGFEEPELW